MKIGSEMECVSIAAAVVEVASSEGDYPQSSPDRKPVVPVSVVSVSSDYFFAAVVAVISWYVFVVVAAYRVATVRVLASALRRVAGSLTAGYGAAAGASVAVAVDSFWPAVAGEVG